MAANLHPENTESGFRAVEGDTLYQTGKGLTILIPEGRRFSEAHHPSMLEDPGQS